MDQDTAESGIACEPDFLYYAGGAALGVLAGCSREVAAIRRGIGKTAVHVLRMIAWLMVGASFFVIASQIPEGSQFVPGAWVLVLDFVPLTGGLGLLLVTFRAAGYPRRKRHAMAVQGRHALSDD
jgi:hypothetical protein